MAGICLFSVFGMEEMVKRGLLEGLLQHWGREWRVGPGGTEGKGRSPGSMPLSQAGVVCDSRWLYTR